MANNSVDVQIKIDNIANVKNEIGKRLATGFAKVGAVGTGHAMEGTPVRTGALKNAMGYDLLDEGVGVQWGVRVDAPALVKGKQPPIEYAQYVENGSSKQEARHMILNSANNYASDYRKIIESELQK